VFSAQNKRKTLSWKPNQIFFWSKSVFRWLKSVFRWSTFIKTNKHMKVWKVNPTQPKLRCDNLLVFFYYYILSSHCWRFHVLPSFWYCLLGFYFLIWERKKKKKEEEEEEESIAMDGMGEEVNMLKFLPFFFLDISLIKALHAFSTVEELNLLKLLFFFLSIFMLWKFI